MAFVFLSMAYILDKNLNYVKQFSKSPRGCKKYVCYRITQYMYNNMYMCGKQVHKMGPEKKNMVEGGDSDDECGYFGHN